MANDVRERLADDGGCCAHLTVKWTTEELPSGFTRGWWECQTCQTHFWPKAALLSQEPPKASEGCGCVGKLNGSVDDLVDDECKYPAAAEKARKYDALKELVEAKAREVQNG